MWDFPFTVLLRLGGIKEDHQAEHRQNSVQGIISATMQLFVPVLLLVIAAVTYGRVAEPVTAPEEVSDDVDSYRWKKPVGLALEKIGKWLQRRGRFYAAEDGDEDDAGDFSPKDLKEIGAELEKLAVALEKGKTLDAALDGDEASEYGIGKWAKRIRGWAKQIPPALTG